MPSPATANKTLTISMLSLSAGKMRPAVPLTPVAQPMGKRTPMGIRLPMPRSAGPVVPAVPPPPPPPHPTPKDGFQLVLAASDGSVKLLTLCDGKVSAGATDLGTIPDSLAAAITTLQSEVAALAVSLTSSNKLTF
jgi:hypothetical protein